MIDFENIQEHKDNPGSPEDILKWLRAYQDYLEDEICANMCDKTYKQQGCPSGACSLAKARKDLQASIDAFERDVFGVTTEEYWKAHEEAQQ